MHDRKKTVAMMSRRYNPLEPVINIYTGRCQRGGGGLPKHVDHRDVTVLVQLSKLSEYDGGGTRFWPERGLWPEEEEARWNGGGGDGPAEQRAKGERETRLVRPEQGTAVLFSGDIYHMGVRTTAGERCLYVSSFDLVPDGH